LRRTLSRTGDESHVRRTQVAPVRDELRIFAHTSAGRACSILMGSSRLVARSDSLARVGEGRDANVCASPRDVSLGFLLGA
jgi:hypothetical protein